jgi:nicotinate phosphoribosyltransferase
MSAIVQPDALLTDLYQLTMMQAYLDGGLTQPASFELFSRKLPAGRGFLLAAGLEQALDYLEAVRFQPEDLEYLASTRRFSRGFLDHLAGFRFGGEVWAMAEGTPFFPDEPVLRVTAALPEAQLVETRLLNLVHFQTIVASKAARMVLAAAGRPLIEFGLRRAHGAEAGILAARASYLAGVDGTSNVLAAQRFGIPPYGTMAHSFVQAHADEVDAFAAFARSQPANIALLIDTYDTEAGAEKVVALARRQPALVIQAVRLDSGDLAAHARKVRRILDDGGLHATRILASGSLDERAIQALVAAGAPIDSFAPGTRLDTSADAPYLDCAYKLVEVAGRPSHKRSEEKATWPGRKQVHRFFEAGSMARDLVTLAETPAPGGVALLERVMHGGRRLRPSPPLVELRARAAASLARLPPHLQRLDEAPRYPVAIGDDIRALAGRPR